MLNNTLNTNEIKNTAGTAQIFERVRLGPGNTTQFKLSAETLGNPYRLDVKHERVGKGQDERRRSAIIFSATDEDVADGTKYQTRCTLTIDQPTGRADDNTTLAILIANMLSFCATTGAGTTVLFDGSGNGAKVLLNETL